MTEKLVEVGIVERLQELARARAVAAEMGGAAGSREAELWATPQWQARQEAYRVWKEQNEKISALECELRDWGIRHYTATGNKAPVKGLIVKLFRLVQYEEANVLAWCKEHASVLIIPASLDKKQFEKAVVSGLAFVSEAPAIIIEEPRSQIASDLSGYLE